MSDESPKTVEETVALMHKISDIVESNLAATTWKKERRMRASELRCCAKQVDGAWKAEKAALDARIADLEKENARLRGLVEMPFKPGDAVEIDCIRMTVTGVKVGFGGHRSYHLVYFQNGREELVFDDGEMEAMGAKKAEGKAR